MANFHFSLPLAFIFLLLFAVGLVVLSAKSTFRLNGLKFSFRRYFPFELYYQKTLRQSSFFRIFLLILFGLSLAIVILFVVTFRKEITNLVFAITVGIFFILGLISTLIIFMLKPNFLSQFKLYVILNFAFVLMSNGTLGILSLSSLYTHIAFKVIGAFALFFAGLTAILMLNPKLKDWARLDKKTNQDGTVSHVRPVVSPLAYSLWLNSVLLMLGELLILISMLLSSLNY
ncbi:MAG: hypothetical protein MJ207_04415 [Bacilli bacterium]|nr:hypothetical protein [Bacilli bacterium]